MTLDGRTALITGAALAIVADVTLTADVERAVAIPRAPSRRAPSTTSPAAGRRTEGW